MNHRVIAAIVAAAVGLAGLPALAAVPDFVTYSGRLTDGTAWGQSDVLEMTFRIYGSAEGDDLLFQQSFPAPDAPSGTPGVAVEDGYFSVMLTGVSDVFGAHDATWITVCIGTVCGPADDLMPRQQVGSVPYAGRAGKADNGVPPGTIVSFGGTTAPEGWLVCNGLSVSRADHPRLFAAIGTAFGAPDAEHFNVPDLRGRFLRGLDGAAGRDPDKGSRTSMAPGGNTGDKVGSTQGDGTKYHDHYLNPDQTAIPRLLWHDPHMADGGGAGFGIEEESIQDSKTASSSQTGGIAETRPINANVIFIIKD